MFTLWPLGFGLFFAVCGVSCPPWHKKLAKGLYYASLGCTLAAAAAFAIETLWL
jgi:hypothetical protein